MGSQDLWWRAVQTERANMGFIRALKFPYRSIPKIVSIALVVVIIFPALMSVAEVGEKIWLSLPDHLASTPAGIQLWRDLIEKWVIAIVLIAAAITLAVAPTWLSGYSVDVIRHLLRGGSSLPAIRFGANLQEGFVLIVSRVAWTIGLTIFLLPLALFVSVLGDVALIGFLAIVGLLMTLQYFVGMARIAVTGKHDAAFELRTNLRVNWRHKLATALLVFGQALLALGYGCAAILMFSEASKLMREILNDPIAVLVIGSTATLIFFLLQHFSSVYLIAQFASKAGIQEYSDNLKTSI